MTDEYSTHELPPFFTTWRQMYAAVIANLFFLILLFYWITLIFFLTQKACLYRQNSPLCKKHTQNLPDYF
jgi:hypothetical protein